MRYKLPGHGLMSFSSMSMFLSCQQKYAFKYIDRLEEEVDEEAPAGALERGKAFHLLVETGGEALVNELLGNDPYEIVRVCSAFDTYEAMQQMGAIPKVQHTEAKLVSEEHQFIGYVDGIAERPDSSWMLAEMKTSQRFDPVSWAVLPVNTQISLYTVFAREFAHREFLDYDQLVGVSYQKIIFSGKKPMQPTKKKRPQIESVEAFAERIKGDAKVHHQMVQPTPHAQAASLATFELVKEAVHGLMAHGTQRVTKNTGNCFAYGRVCEFFAACHGKSFSDLEEGSGTTRLENDLDETLMLGV